MAFPRNSWPLLAPACIVAGLALSVAMSGFDLRLADALYAWEGGDWSLRSAFLTKAFVHEGGRDAVTAAWLAVAIAFASTWLRTQWRPWRRPLGCLALSVLLSTVAVSLLKSWTHVNCPWDLARYGGGHAYADLFSPGSVAFSGAGCFPAGHASSGYAWVALYFFCVAVQPSRRWAGLCTGLALGLLFGVSQQLRGAHFLSHDLWSAAICWLVAFAVHAAAGQPLQPRQVLR